MAYRFGVRRARSCVLMATLRVVVGCYCTVKKVLANIWFIRLVLGFGVAGQAVCTALDNVEARLYMDQR